MTLLDLLFPKRCFGCKKFGDYFCQNCQKDILQSELVCPVCERSSVSGLTHPLCKGKFKPDGLWSLGIYQGPLKKAIQSLKYRFVRELADELVDLVVEYWAKYSPYLLDRIKGTKGEGWAITSVPLYWSRKNWRGFNQSELIAKMFAQKLGLKYEGLLERSKKTRPQVGLESNKRHQNIKGAFSLTPNILISSSPNILLIDDVWTTGSTLKECCYVLKRGGAKEVWDLTLAR